MVPIRSLATCSDSTACPSMAGLRLSSHAAFSMGCMAVTGVAVTWHVWGREAAGVVATLVTFAAIAWTAYETAALRAETVRQTELQQRPFVALQGPHPDALSIVNLGLGLAVAVEVVTEELAEPDHEPLRFRLRHPVPLLAPGVEAPIEVTTELLRDLPSGERHWTPVAMREGVLFRDHVRLRLRYLDAVGTVHLTTHEWRNDRFVVVPQASR